MDYDEKGWGAVLVALVGITVLFVAFFLAAARFDRRLAPAPVRATTG